MGNLSGQTHRDLLRLRLGFVLQTKRWRLLMSSKIRSTRSRSNKRPLRRDIQEGDDDIQPSPEESDDDTSVLTGNIEVRVIRLNIYPRHLSFPLAQFLINNR